MTMPDKRDEAARLYVRRSMAPASVAKEIGVSESTVYRWRAESAERGEAFDWDAQRRIYNLSPRELVGLYVETVKAWLVRVKADPEVLADSKLADAMSKHISSIQKIDSRSQYLGVAIDLIRVANSWLGENQPKLKEKLDPYWDAIYQELANYATGKGMF